MLVPVWLLLIVLASGLVSGFFQIRMWIDLGNQKYRLTRSKEVVAEKDERIAYIEHALDECTKEAVERVASKDAEIERLTEQVADLTNTLSSIQSLVMRGRQKTRAKSAVPATVHMEVDGKMVKVGDIVDGSVSFTEVSSESADVVQQLYQRYCRTNGWS